MMFVFHHNGASKKVTTYCNQAFYKPVQKNVQSVLHFRKDLQPDDNKKGGYSCPAMLCGSRLEHLRKRLANCLRKINMIIK